MGGFERAAKIRIEHGNSTTVSSLKGGDS